MRSRRWRQLLLMKVFCLSLVMALSGNTAGASATTRAISMLHEQFQFTVQAGGNETSSAGATALKPKTAGGRHVLTLDRSDASRTVIAPIGTLIFLRFGPGYRVSIPSSGVLSSPFGNTHLPKNIISLLRVVATGTVTITVTGSPAIPASSSNGSISPNWSGYEMQGSYFTEVAGSWVVPTAASSLGTTNSSTWIGIGGDQDMWLIQTGTQQTNTFGIGTYGAWWQVLPLTPYEQNINAPVAPGDHMSAAIRRDQSDVWTIAIADQTKGWIFTTQQTYGGRAITAEWIMEAPSSSSNSVESLANYGHTYFDGALANNVNPHFTESNMVTLEQCNSSGAQCTLSIPSRPDSEADGFSVAYNSTPAPPSSSTCPTPLLWGDLNGDGVVDLTDLSIFAGDWGRGPRNGNLLHSAYSDINCNGVVDLIDFSIFAANWHKQWHAQATSSEVMGAAPSPVVTGSNNTTQDASSATMAISPSTGTFNVGDIVTASLMVDGGGQAFNAAQATVNVTGPATVQSLAPGDCGFSFAQAPTTSDPSFPGAILGASSTKCTVYTVTLRVTGSSPVGITLSDAAVLDAASSSDILSSVTNATYNASAPTDTPQPSATGVTISTVTPANTATPTGTPAAIASSMPIAPTATDIPPTNTPSPTETNTPTNTPAATAPPTSTNTPVPPMSTPTTAPTSTATDTPTANATPTSAPTGTPTATVSPTTPPATAVKGPSSSSQNAPATTPTTAAKPRANTNVPRYGQGRHVMRRPHTSPVALTLKVTPRVVASGRWLTVSIRTAPHAHVALLLQLPVRRTVSVKKGKNRVRVTRTVILRLATAQGFADTRGQFTRGLHVAYKVSRPVRASLTVTMSTAHGRIIRQAPVTIQPASHHLTVRVTPHVLMLGRPLVVAAHTLPHVAVVVDLHIMERRMVTVAKGRTHVRVARTAQVYGVSWHGRTGPKGWASPTFRVPSRSGQSLTATLTVTAALPHGLDVHTISVPMR